jgi:hypothetical protein
MTAIALKDITIYPVVEQQGPEAVVGPITSISSPSRPGGEFPLCLRRQAAPRQRV